MMATDKARARKTLFLLLFLLLGITCWLHGQGQGQGHAELGELDEMIDDDDNDDDRFVGYLAWSPQHVANAMNEAQSTMQHIVRDWKSNYSSNSTVQEGLWRTMHSLQEAFAPNGTLKHAASDAILILRGTRRERMAADWNGSFAKSSILRDLSKIKSKSEMLVRQAAGEEEEQAAEIARLFHSVSKSSSR